MAVVNQLARQLLHVDHPGSDDIVARQNQLNSKWSSLREKSELKREEYYRKTAGKHTQIIADNRRVLP